MPEINQTNSKNSKNSKKSNGGRGGSRKGAGRKVGAATKKTREIADKAAAEGITPLEVMLRTMRALVGRFDALHAQAETDEGRAAVPLDLMVEASGIAKDAAPYMHPRLTATEISGPGGGPVQTESKLDVSGLSNDQLRALASIPVQAG